ncbi:MAG: hypothetical protein V2J55_11365 [Candidatus Competibacteraceae bacterium]|jgi:hypothetical protein|nr:hypothetical protein [Candidatus Competibacteraceae bacterium]
MTAALFASQLLFVSFCLWFWWRLHTNSQRLADHLEPAASQSALVANLNRQLQAYLDKNLFARADSRGFSRVLVTCRETHDGYRNVEELLAFVATLTDQDQISQQEKLIKAIYQLQDALNLPDKTLQACLHPILEQLQHSTVLGRQVGAVEQVRRGDPADARSMWLLTRGTRVQQPLGVVVRDPEGKIINKAKVLCA